MIAAKYAYSFNVPLDVCNVVGLYLTGNKPLWQCWFYHRDATHFSSSQDLPIAMETANEFAYTSRLSSGVSFDALHYDVLTGFFSPCANSPRSGAQQMVRVRNISTNSGFFSVAEDHNRKKMSKPLGYPKNKALCLNREHFSLNLLDDWGYEIKTLRVKTPEEMRALYFHLCNEKALAARPRLYKKMLAYWNRESGYTIRCYEEFERANEVTQYLNSILGCKATNTIASMSGAIPPYFRALNPLEQEGLIVRPQIGSRPEYCNIKVISPSRYNVLFIIPEAVMTTENFYEMRRYEYDALF